MLASECWDSLRLRDLGHHVSAESRWSGRIRFASSRHTARRSSASAYLARKRWPLLPQSSSESSLIPRTIFVAAPTRMSTSQHPDGDFRRTSADECRQRPVRRQRRIRLAALELHLLAEAVCRSVPGTPIRTDRSDENGHDDHEPDGGEEVERRERAPSSRASCFSSCDCFFLLRLFVYSPFYVDSIVTELVSLIGGSHSSPGRARTEAVRL